jgi:bacterioferritin
MATHPRLAAYLGQALSHEMTAVQQYLTQSRLCRLWGFGEHAQWLEREAHEELGHASLLIDQMLLRGLPPNATRLDPARPGRDWNEMVRIDRQLEWQAVVLYDEALQFSERCRDADLMALFSRLLADERGHLEELDNMLAHAQAERITHVR